MEEKRVYSETCGIVELLMKFKIRDVSILKIFSVDTPLQKIFCEKINKEVTTLVANCQNTCSNLINLVIYVVP